MHDTYAEYMAKNPTENTRVDQQFDLLTQNIGYTIHPSIASTLPSTPAVADIGTGTGRYLTQLAAEYPSARLVGFDISSALFPARSALPPNVTLATHDARTAFPAAHHAAFDLVHVRALTPSLDAGDWAEVLAHAAALLRPGGALQWEEPNWTTTEHVRGRAGSSCGGARALGGLFRGVLGARVAHGWNELPALMGGAAAGLERVERDVVSSDRLPETRWALSVNTMVAMCLFADIMAKQGAIDASEADVERLGEQGFRDVDSGCYIRYDLHVAVAFKSRSAD